MRKFCVIFVADDVFRSSTATVSHVDSSSARSARCSTVEPIQDLLKERRQLSHPPSREQQSYASNQSQLYVHPESKHFSTPGMRSSLIGNSSSKQPPFSSDVTDIHRCLPGKDIQGYFQNQLQVHRYPITQTQSNQHSQYGSHSDDSRDSLLQQYSQGYHSPNLAIDSHQHDHALARSIDRGRFAVGALLATSGHSENGPGNGSLSGPMDSVQISMKQSHSPFHSDSHGNYSYTSSTGVIDSLAASSSSTTTTSSSRDSEGRRMLRDKLRAILFRHTDALLELMAEKIVEDERRARQFVNEDTNAGLISMTADLAIEALQNLHF